MWIVLIVMLWIPSMSFADYVDARVVSNEIQVDGRSLIVLSVRGDAGEMPVQLKYTVPANPSMQELRYAIHAKVSELNAAIAVSNSPAVRPGQTIAPLARPNPVPPAPTAKQVWRGKYGRYNSINDSGITAASAEKAALKADLEATYEVGFLD